MKNKLSCSIAILALLITTAACKGEKKNGTEAIDAQPTATASPVAAKYKVAIANSIINWTGSKPTGKHTGTIAIESGIVKTSDQKIVSGSFLIDMKSIIVTDLEGDKKEGLEGHLKGVAEGKEDHFFNVAKYPTAAFEITGVTENAGKSTVQGNLTIRGIKKNISFPATAAATANGMTLTSDPFTINRTDWGINYGSKSIFDNLGDKFIDDAIELQVVLTANKI